MPEYDAYRSQQPTPSTRGEQRVRLFACMCVYPSVRPSICPSVCLPACLSVQRCVQLPHPTFHCCLHICDNSYTSCQEKESKKQGLHILPFCREDSKIKMQEMFHSILQEKA
jgi:hypothetical protein